MNDHKTPLGRRVLTIRTPENIELTYALAGAGSRAAAYVVDVFAMLAAGQVLGQLLILVLSLVLKMLNVDEESGAWLAALGGLLSFGLYNGYFILFEWLWNGQTPGKRLLNIQVVGRGGHALRFTDTLLRNLLRVIDFLPLFYGVGLVSLLMTRDSQRLGDLVAGTLVVYQDPAEIESLLPEPAAGAVEAPALPAAAVEAVPGELVGLVGVYLRSREEMAPRPRQETAAELAVLVRETSGLAPEPGRGVESFLESIVRGSEQGPPSSYPHSGEVEILS